MTIVVILELNAKPGKRAALVDYLDRILPDTRKKPGFIDIKVCSEAEKPNAVVAVELWESRQAYETYLAWRVETGTIEEILAFADGPPNIRFLTPSS